MCGIASVFLQPRKRAAEDWQAIRDIFTRNLVFNEARGRAASGVALIQQDGKIQVFKKPVPASELVQMDRYMEIMDLIGERTVCILGHTRMPTKGSQWNNDNNHPVVALHTIGVHNGQIENDDALFAEFGLSRQGEVDSEIIFHLLGLADPYNDDEYLSHLEEKTKKMEGKIVSMTVDLRRPTRLVVIKRDNPLSLHYESAFQALFFSSRYLFLRKAFGRAVLTEAIDNQTIHLFDADALPHRGSSSIAYLHIN